MEKLAAATYLVTLPTDTGHKDVYIGIIYFNREKEND
jgi:hypothetical protein